MCFDKKKSLCSRHSCVRLFASLLCWADFISSMFTACISQSGFADDVDRRISFHIYLTIKHISIVHLMIRYLGLLLLSLSCLFEFGKFVENYSNKKYLNASYDYFEKQPGLFTLNCSYLNSTTYKKVKSCINCEKLLLVVYNLFLSI